MNVLRVSPLLRFALRLDAIATAGTGAAMIAFAEPLEALLQLPANLMIAAGVFMLAYAAIVGWLSLRNELPRWAAWAVVVGNGLWAIDCAALAFVGGFDPSTLGIAFLLVQAVVVFGFAELQYVGLKRSTLAT